MAGMIGMDVEAVDLLASNLKSQGDAIQGVINAVNQLVVHSQDVWRGQDASQFQQWWETQHRPALQRVMEAVNGLGQAAQNNASEQRQASGH